MCKEIWFDLDGTLVDLYGVDNWLDYLINYDAYPYVNAKPLYRLSIIARYLNKLQKQGYVIGICSWLSKDSNNDYDIMVTTAKIEWLNKHMPSVHFNSIDILPYGTPKQLNRGGILFDDEAKNRDSWNGKAYHPNAMMDILKVLATEV